MDLGAKIKHYLLKKYDTVQHAADAIGIKRQQLYPYFNNKVEPGAGFLQKLLEDGCDINWLLSKDESKFEKSLMIMEEKIKYQNDLSDREELKKELRQIKSQVDSVIRKLNKED